MAAEGTVVQTWEVIDEGAPGYLDGIRSQYTVRDCGEIAEVVAYAFEADRARLIAAAPTMFGYVSSRAAAGDPEAKEIMERINANP